MKALTVWQPWASLIAIGAKPYEFRKWDYSTRDRSLEGARIVIHAGARPMKLAEIVDLEARLLAGERATALAIDKALPIVTRIRAGLQGKGERFDLPLSQALCTVTLLRARKASDLFGGADSDRVDHHLWAWPLQAIALPREPVPCRGAQGFWNFPRDLEKAMPK